jgi:2-polyprenyl-3-methyl-5-hydroxy-6-metoxy-1,4-benzoquinol methylase
VPRPPPNSNKQRGHGWPDFSVAPRDVAEQGRTIHFMPLDRRNRHAIAARFESYRQRIYIAAKLASDPVYAATADVRGSSRLPLFDIGCGIGLLAHYLQRCGRLESYTGFDHDARKIEAGKLALARGQLGHKVQLRCGDAVTGHAGSGDVAMLDVLHYLPRERQPTLLKAAAALLAPAGVLVLRNVIREPNWRFRLTVWEEHLLKITGWIPGGAQHYPTAEEIRAPLEQAGLKVTMRPLRGRTPFNSFLLVARRA